MSASQQKTLFAIDPGATNWRLYRAVYEVEGRRTHLLSEPAPSPLTSFSERSLPAALILNPAGDGLECFGETAIAQLENQAYRDRLRAHFKTAIGAYLSPETHPVQVRYTHDEALGYTRLLLSAIREGVRREKWRGGAFDKDVIFSFAYPVHWGSEHDGIILADFKAAVRTCFPDTDQASLRFVSEPEAAIYSLQRSALLPDDPSEKVTLILDIGGSTTDLVASELGGEEPVFLASFGGAVGGDLYDVAISDHIAEVLRIPVDTFNRDLALGFTLRSVARRLKEALSRQLLHDQELNIIPQRTVTVVSAEGEVFRGAVELDEASFQSLTRHVHEHFQELFQHALEAMGLSDEEISRIVLVGGGSQLFSIVRYLRERFGFETVLVADNPGESVVHGVSLEYGAAMAERRPTMLFMTGVKPASDQELAPSSSWKLISESGEVIPLKAGANTIGRAPSNDIHINSEKISRWHAELTPDEAGCSLRDLGSTNGTYLDGERLKAQQVIPLRDGAQLRFGDRSFSLEAIGNV